MVIKTGLLLCVWLAAAVAVAAETPAGATLATGPVGKTYPYWVVGSYAKEADADREAARLGRRTGATVAVVQFEVRGTTAYRLLVPGGHPAPDVSGDVPGDVPEQFQQAGVRSPWLLRLDTPRGEGSALASATTAASPTVPDRGPAASLPQTGPVYLVAGSYEDIQQSIDVERKLHTLFTGVTSKSQLADGLLYYRVMVGPMDSAEVPAFAALLAQAGIEGAYPVAVDPAARSLLDSAAATIRATVRQAPAVSAVDRAASRAPVDDFNFATLRPRKD